MSGPAGPPNWEEVERVMAAFLDLPENQRAAYLAQQPAAIRAEVESLVAAYGSAGSFLGGETGKPAVTAELLHKMKLAFAAANSRLSSGSASDTGPVAVRVGTQIGPYRIESILGKGGMGVVHRALDTKLNRPVAVKFLFEELADAAARRRFQREAQTASSLNHPHILTVYDAGDFEGRQYLVTEFIDGGTLRDWARAKHTWREIVSLLVGVADGLATAHAAGILHRDIKPDNILVGKNGYAKLSDFGLAKLEEREGPGEATQTLATGPGMILGTFAYMSPEQASGKTSDARSDIFSFGIVLYELLGGRRPFIGATDQELLQTIIHGTAPPLGPDVPMALRMIVEKALENAPADRYQSTRDLVVDLRRLTRQSADPVSGTTSTPAASAPPAGKSWKLVALSAVVLLTMVVGGVFLWRFQHPAAQAPRQVVQFDIPQPPGTIFTPSISRQPFAISPDGKRLAFSATGSGGTNIWVRELASPEMHMLPGSSAAWSMFWSPDSRSVYFTVRGTLKEVNLETGTGRTVREFPDFPMLGTWRSNRELLLYMGPGEIHELRLQDGSIQKGPVFPGMRWPQMLSGGDRLVYAVYDKESKQSHGMASLYKNPAPVSLMETTSRVQYAPPLNAGEPGHLVFIRGASLLAQPFDAEQLRLAGEPSSIAQNIIYYGPNLSASFSVSSNGVLVYQAGFPNAQLKWYDRSGNELGDVGSPAPFWGQLRLSRDGKRVTATLWNPENGGTDAWIFATSGRETRRLTFPPEVDRRPVWSPDQTHLAIGRSGTVGIPSLVTLDLSGSGTPETFVNEAPKEHVLALPTDWSSDGKWIAMDDGLGEEQHSIWIADAVKHTMKPFLKNNLPQWGMAFSPDVKRIAFVSLESGRPEIYVQAFEPAPEPHVVGEKRMVSREGAWLVRWRSDGRELFFLGLDNLLHAAAVKGPAEFDEPKPLFRIPGAPQFGTTRDFQFDVSPDGQRFLMPTTGSVPPPPFTVIENWQDKFRRN